MASLFSMSGAPGSLYESIRTSDHPSEQEARARIDRLWSSYRPFADRHFVQEFRLRTHDRYWEMYLTCLLLSQDRQVECPKPKGPDILVIDGNRSVWIEAVTASGGDDSNPDRVTEPERAAAFIYPEDQVVLRYRNSIDAKWSKYQVYQDEGIVSDRDAWVIAVHGAGVPLAWVDDDDVPRIVKALLPFGVERATIDLATGAVVASDYEYRPAIARTSGSLVSTDLFLDPAFDLLSAVVFSGANISNAPASDGEDLLLVHNPRARNPLPVGWLAAGREFYVQQTGDQYELRNLDHRHEGSG
jgi:hypothetical protein